MYTQLKWVLEEFMFASYNTREFENYIKQLRESLNMTQKAVHKSTGLSLEN